MSKLVTTLWYAEKVEEAATFYASVLPRSSVDRVTTLPADTPGGPEGSVKIVEFTLMGQPFMAFSASRPDAFTHAISLTVRCDDQTELDRIWAALSDGGKVEQCGWLKDRYGVSWQIVPSALGDMMSDPDRARARHVAEAMLQMVKLDTAALRRAYDAAG